MNWVELRSLGAKVRNGRMLADAEAVAHETMTIVRENLEILIAGLQAHGFQFGIYPDGEDVPGYLGPMEERADDVDEAIAEIERLAGGPVPLSLAAFWRLVGRVELVGSHADWPEGSDPLWVFGPHVTLDEYRDFEDNDRAVIAPDALHKDNVSGGEPYTIALPNAAADGVLLGEGRDLYFVDYLRDAFRWGGFPGFAGDPARMPRWLMHLTEQLRRF